MYANLPLGNETIKAVLKKAVAPSERRDMVSRLAKDQRLSIKRSYQVMNLSRAAYYREENKLAVRDAPVVEALNAVLPSMAGGDSGKVMTALSCRVIHGITSGLAGVLRHEAQSAASHEEALDQADAIAFHPAGQAESKCFHRVLQPVIPDRSAQQLVICLAR